MKSRYLCVRNILNTLNTIAEQKQAKLNLKVLRINIGPTDEQDKLLFFYLYHPKLYAKMIHLNLINQDLEEQLNRYFTFPNFCSLIKEYFDKFNNYIDAGNVEIVIPSCNNLQVLYLANLMCKIDISNVIKQGSDLILLSLENMISRQLIVNNRNNINNNNNIEEENRLSCDCLLLKYNSKYKFGIRPYWKIYIEHQHYKYNTDTFTYGKSNISSDNDMIKFTDDDHDVNGVALLPRFFYSDFGDCAHSYTYFTGINIIESNDLINYQNKTVEVDFPWYLATKKPKQLAFLKKESIESESDSSDSSASESDSSDSSNSDHKRKRIRKLKQKINIIDLYIKKGLTNKNVYFVQLRSLDDLFYRLIKMRYFNNDVYKQIWSNYTKWFDMGLISWVNNANQMYPTPHVERRHRRSRK